LLVQDCIQRFDALEPALEWCCSRPAGGAASIVLADAEGRIASVRVDGERRRVERGETGLLVAAARDADRVRLEKAAVECAHVDGDAVGDLLLGAGSARSSVARLDPVARTVSVLRAGLAPTVSRF
jgi:hypothetical protein